MEEKKWKPSKKSSNFTGYIDRLETVTNDLIDACVAKGLRTPEFVQDEDFRVIIWRKGTKMNEPQNEPQIQSDKTTYRRCRVLLETIISNPYLTKEDLGKQLGVSESTIKRDIDKLRKTYRITWIGPTIGGRWEVGHK